MNVIFLVKVMLFVRISIETPPHHPCKILAHHIFVSRAEKHLHDSNEILFPLMKTSAAMNEKPAKKNIKKKEENLRKRQELFYTSMRIHTVPTHVHAITHIASHRKRNRWNVIQMEGCFVL